MLLSGASVAQFLTIKRVLQRPKQMVVRRRKVVGYKLGARKLSNQVQLIFPESSKMCVAWHDETQLSFCWPILVALPGLLGSNGRVPHSTGPNRWSLSLPIPPKSQHNLVWRQSRVWSRLRRVISLWPWSVAFNILIFQPFFIAQNDSLQKWFDFVGFQRHFPDSNSVNQASYYFIITRLA